MKIDVKLEAFEGPLDLLLHLIEKNKVSIYDWQFVASGKKEEKEESAPVYDEHTCADEDDLPM